VLSWAWGAAARCWYISTGLIDKRPARDGTSFSDTAMPYQAGTSIAQDNPLKHLKRKENALAVGVDFCPENSWSGRNDKMKRHQYVSA
jgi:hypothetical protein